MKPFKHGLLVAAVSVASLAATAASASAVTVNVVGGGSGPESVVGNTANGSGADAAFTVGASVLTCDGQATGTINPNPKTGTTVSIPLSGVSFTGCSMNFATGATVTPSTGWSIIVTSSSGAGYVQVTNSTTVAAGICTLTVPGQQVTGSLDDAANDIVVNDTTMSFTSSGGGCFLMGIPSSGTSGDFTARYDLNRDVDVS